MINDFIHHVRVCSIYASNSNRENTEQTLATQSENHNERSRMQCSIVVAENLSSFFRRVVRIKLNYCVIYWSGNLGDVNRPIRSRSGHNVDGID